MPSRSPALHAFLTRQDKLYAAIAGRVSVPRPTLWTLNVSCAGARGRCRHEFDGGDGPRSQHACDSVWQTARAQHEGAIARQAAGFSACIASLRLLPQLIHKAALKSLSEPEDPEYVSVQPITEHKHPLQSETWSDARDAFCSHCGRLETHPSLPLNEAVDIIKNKMDWQQSRSGRRLSLLRRRMIRAHHTTAPKRKVSTMDFLIMMLPRFAFRHRTGPCLGPNTRRINSPSAFA